MKWQFLTEISRIQTLARNSTGRDVHKCNGMACFHSCWALSFHVRHFQEALPKWSMRLKFSSISPLLKLLKRLSCFWNMSIPNFRYLSFNILSGYQNDVFIHRNIIWQWWRSVISWFIYLWTSLISDSNPRTCYLFSIHPFLSIELSTSCVQLLYGSLSRGSWNVTWILW